MEANPFDPISKMPIWLGDMDNYEERKVAAYEKDDLLIDTAWVNDFSWYETAISHPQYNDDKWIIVEQYGQDRDAAEKGHEEWVEVMIAEELPPELVDIDSYNLGLEPFKRKETE